MPNPKRKISRSKRDKRRSQWFSAMRSAQLGVCSHCGEKKVSHQICPHCGYYKGRNIIVPKTS